MKLQETQRPNVLFISTDQMRGDFMGCNGHPIVMTPQMDQLANEGINFQKGFSECPTCVPARRIMMTGLNTYGIKMNRNDSNQPFNEGPKLAELMTKAGYQTFACGKLHTTPMRNRIGFEEAIINEEGRSRVDKDDYERYLDNHGLLHLVHTHGIGNNQYNMRISPLERRHSTTNWTADTAMQFIERRDPTRPFFMHVSFDKPHPPLTPCLEYYELYRDVQMPDPIHGDWEENKRPSQTKYQILKNNMDVYKNHVVNTQQILRAYAAQVTHIDSMLGTLFGTLREHKLLDNTIIIITADHGDCLYDYDHTAKINFFRGSASIPYIIRPSREWIKLNDFKQGTVDTSTPATLADIMPTILHMCGVGVPENIAGQSLIPVMLEEQTTSYRNISFGNCCTSYTANNGKYKYIWYSEDDYEYLFDTDNDPRDQHDLVDDPQYSATKSELKSALARWMFDNNDERSNGNELIQVDYDWKLDKAKHRTSWNNRGRH